MEQLKLFFSQVANTSNGSWHYANGYLTENFSHTEGANAPAPIKWISENEFIITIIDNGDPYYNGLQRRYYRQNRPTTAAKKPTSDYSGLRRAQDSYGDVNNSWGEFYRSF